MRGLRYLVACAAACTALVVAGCAPPTTGANTPPTASFTATPTSGVAPLTVGVDASASFDTGGSVATYAWNFGDGGTATGVTSTHEYTADGTFTITLTVTDNGGLTATTTRTVTVGVANVPPVAIAGADATSGVAPLSVTFSSAGSADTDGTIADYEWDFGDSSPVSHGDNPFHTYTDPGIYTATLTVTDDDGATAQDSVTVTVNANQAPTVSASADVTTGKAPLPVAFTATASDVDGTIASYNWNFGDSTNGSGATAAHTYAAAGNYTATVTVTDDKGATAAATVNVVVTANQAPVAVASSNVTAGPAPLVVNFDATNSSDSDGTIASYLWNFGGGITSSSATASYTFPTQGTYPVTLTVTDDNGATDTDTISIEVGPTPNVPPTAAMTANPTSGKRNLTVAFNDTSTDSDGTITTRSWNFGDGSPVVNGAATSHTYTVAGTYTATLTVTDNAGATASTTQTITVTPNQAPTAAASATPATVKEDKPVSFSSSGSADSDGTIASYLWDFKDGVTSTSANPTHTFADPGTYVVELTVTDDTGDSSAATTTVTVLANVAPTAVINAAPQTGARGMTVAFSSAGSTDGDGTIAGYSWNFGNGNSSTAENPSATYPNAGTFTATLTVTDDNGATDSESVTITVYIDDDADGVSPPADCNDNSASTYPGAADTLDASGTDSNCDGVDGVLADTILVAGTGGSDVAGCGQAVASPCQSIAFGISQAGASRHAVLVTGNGTAYGSFALNSATGVTVRGGYGANFVSRSGTTTVSGGVSLSSSTSVTLADMTVNGPGGANATGIAITGTSATLKGLTVTSGTASGAGSSAYGVRASGSTVDVQSSDISASAGIAGTSGSTPSGALTAGTNGA
ncbi:MAG: PKD domain-containing protein, partial [Microthrixaceae bacterium]